jgi:hypothetical protein
MSDLQVSTYVLPRDVMERIRKFSTPRLSFALLPKEVLARIMEMAGPRSSSLFFFASKAVLETTKEVVRTDLPCMCAEWIQRFTRWGMSFWSSRMLAIEFQGTTLANIHSLQLMG